MGQPGRWANTIAEDPDGPWTPLNVTEGFGRDTSTITCTSLYAIFGQEEVKCVEPEVILNMMLAHVFTHWRRSTYLIVVSRMLAQVLADGGWTKERTRQFLLDNAKASVAEVKRRGHCATGGKRGNALRGEAAAEALRVQPGDENTYVFLFKDNGPLEAVFDPRHPRDLRLRFRKDVMLMVGGGDGGNAFSWRGPHGRFSPVTVPIERPDS